MSGGGLYLDGDGAGILIKALKETFPRLQFVTTTHSPMILPYLRQEELFLVGEDGKGNVDVQPAQQSPMLMTGSEIYDVFFGIDQIHPKELRKDLRRYGQLAGDPFRNDEEDEELEKLRHRLAAQGVEPGWEPAPRRDASAERETAPEGEPGSRA